jgi:hypothetical protein
MRRIILACALAVILGVPAFGQGVDPLIGSGPFKRVLLHIYDGMPHPTTGNPEWDSTAFTRVGNTINWVRFKQGKIVEVGQGVIVPDRIVNATPAMRKISRNTKEALKQIGAESPLNARRVRKYGVNVEEEEQPDPLPGLEN